MLISLDWLNEYVKIDDKNINELENGLTMIGQEVEAIEKQGENLENVVVGKVVELKQHPDADKLTLCQVNVGGTENTQIICGAKNHKQGDKVIVAKVGAVLPGDFKIKKAKLRGVESAGMLCSGKELGISEDHEGIVILPEDAPIGMPIKEYLSLNDVVFELEITPNRPDCLSHIGIAREIAAYYERKVKYPYTEINEVEEKAEESISVEIQNKELCKRYATRVIKNVEVKKSPEWLQKRLASMGIKSINNVVDVTNFILMETGHPMHAFDYADISGHKLIVRNANEKEKIETLDGKLRELSKDMLVIADTEKAVAIAGVMGGANSQVKESTKDIVLEIADFKAEKIRRTSKDLTLSSDSSYRFERGIDREDTIEVANRAAKLIQEVAGGKILKGIVEENIESLQKNRITVNLNKINKFIGKEIPKEKVYSILQNLNLEVIEKEEGNIEVVAPTYRGDLERKADIYEEVTRMYGFENIEAKMPSENIQAGKVAEDLYNTRRFKKELRSLGLQEVINYSFISKIGLEKINSEKEVVEIKNPISEEMEVMRPTLIFSLLQNIKDNFNKNIYDVKIYEISKIFNPGKEEVAEERVKIGIALGGKDTKHIWKVNPNKYDFFELKGYVEELFDVAGLKSYKLERSQDKTFHPGRSAEIMVGKDCIGVFGEIHPDVLTNMGIKEKTYVAEIDMEKMLKYSKSKVEYERIIKYPAVDRDLAIVVKEDVMAGNMIKDIERSNNIIEKVELFDVYSGDRVENGYKSIALNIKFRSKKGTLEEKEVTDAMDKILGLVSKKYDGKIRS